MLVGKVVGSLKYIRWCAWYLQLEDDDGKVEFPGALAVSLW